MKVRYLIDAHKGVTFIVVAALMVAYNCFTPTAWIYLALHGTYSILWVLKDAIYPDKRWNQSVVPGAAAIALVILSLYWVAPYLLTGRGVDLPPWLLALAVALNLIGVFLHFASDAQKYYSLQYRSGLVQQGLFARTRNLNYLGELLIYLSFAMLANHWLPYLILAGTIAGLWLPNMRQKDRSLARYEGFEAYRRRSGLLLPQLVPPRQTESLGQSR